MRCHKVSKECCGPGSYDTGPQSDLYNYGVAAEGLVEFYGFIAMLVGRHP